MVPFHSASKVNQIVPYRSISICKIQHSKANASVFFLGFFECFKYQSTVFNTAGNFYHESFLLPSFDVSIQSHISTHPFLYQSEKDPHSKLILVSCLLGRGNHLSFLEVLSMLVSEISGLHTSPK